MKKIFILFFLFIVNIYSKEVVGYINFLTNEDLQEISKSDDPNIYLKNKYSNKYYAEIREESIKIYPRLKEIVYKENVYSKEKLKSIVSDIKVGDILDNSVSISPLIKQIIEDNGLYNIELIYSINDFGDVILNVIDKSKSDYSLKLGMEVKQNQAKPQIYYQKNEIFKNDSLKLEAYITIKDYFTNTNLQYERFDYNGNKIILDLGFSKEKGFYLSSEYNRYFIKEKDKEKDYLLKPKAKIYYINKNDKSNFITAIGLTFDKKFSNDLYVNTDFDFSYNILNNFSDNFLILENDTTIKYNFLESKNEIRISSKKLKNENKLMTKNKRYTSENFKGDYIISTTNNMITSVLLDARGYIFTDATLVGDYDRNLIFNTSLGAGIIYEISPIKTEAYLGINYNTLNKTSIIGGVSLEFEM